MQEVTGFPPSLPLEHTPNKVHNNPPATKQARFLVMLQLLPALNFHKHGQRLPGNSGQATSQHHRKAGKYWVATSLFITRATLHYDTTILSNSSSCICVLAIKRSDHTQPDRVLDDRFAEALIEWEESWSETINHPSASPPNAIE